MFLKTAQETKDRELMKIATYSICLLMQRGRHRDIEKRAEELVVHCDVMKLLIECISVNERYGEIKQ